MSTPTNPNELQKAYTYLRVRGKTVMAPAIIDAARDCTYLYTPSVAGPVDVVRYPMSKILFDANNVTPGFKAFTLNDKPYPPNAMCTKSVPASAFPVVRPEIATALLNARKELIAYGPRVKCF